MLLKKIYLLLIVLLTTTFVFFQTAQIIDLSGLFIVMFALCIPPLIMCAPRIIIKKTMILYFAIVALMSISLSYTWDFTSTISYIAVMLYGAILMIILPNEKIIPIFFIKVLLIFSLLNVFISLIMFFFPNTEYIIQRVLPDLRIEFEYLSGILGQTGTNSYVIVFSVVYFAIKLFTEKEVNSINLFFFTASLFALVLTGKRGPLIWAFVAIIIVDLINLRVRNGNFMKRAIVYIFICLCLASFFILIADSSEQAGNALRRFSENDKISGDYSTGRFDLYTSAIKVIKENYIFGIGAGAYANYSGMNVHNDYLQILVENGVLCAILFYLFIIQNLVYAIKKTKSEVDHRILYLVGLQIFLVLNANTGMIFTHYGFYFIYIMTCVSTCCYRGKSYKTGLDEDEQNASIRGCLKCKGN